MNYYDISDINCWIVYQMPFGDKSNYNKIKNHQDFCIKNKFFAMGWAASSFEKNFMDDITEVDTDETDRRGYLYAYNICNPKYINKPKNALKDYLKIKRGDYVVMRGKDAHYYIGKVKSKRAQYLYKNDDQYKQLSWGYYVEDWREFKSEKELPAELIGRLSQRQHSTIQRVSGYRLRFLIVEAYLRNKDCKEGIEDLPKIKINENNYVRSLNYKQLEDLVSLYINDKHKSENYLLMPSSCKMNEQKYEFFFKSPNKNPITCQVKNQKEINIKDYYKENHYERIYIFSGIWSNDNAKALNDKAERENQNNNIYVISPEELYKSLEENEKYLDLDSYYELSTNVQELNLDGFIIRKKFNKKNHFICKKDNSLISFFSDAFFYSKEFDSMFLSYHFWNDEKINEENEIIAEIIEKLEKNNNFSINKIKPY